MLDEFSRFLLDPALADQVRLLPGAFTRERHLTLPRMAAMMISGMCASVQSELDAFFGHLRGHAVRTREVSARAFSKARQGFSARLFHLASRRLLELASPIIDAARWNGLRVVAADASRLRVSTRSNASLPADHYAFALFLPGAELTLHASLHPADGSERQMLFEALDELDAGSDLLVLDRGYVGNTMVATLAQRGLAFCLRADARGWRCVEEFLRSDEEERIVTLGAPSGADGATDDLQVRPAQVRLIRDVTPGGRIRVLMTNLLDTCRYPADQFGALYHQRWRVEEAFKRIKHRLRLEAPTGLSYLGLPAGFRSQGPRRQPVCAAGGPTRQARRELAPESELRHRCAQADPRWLPAGHRPCARDATHRAGNDRPQSLSHPARSNVPKAAEGQAASAFGIQGGLS